MTNHAVRAAFVVEQTLGHVTHAQNLRAALDEHPTIAATWLPISFDVNGPSQFVPMLRTNWSVRASWRARRALDRSLARVKHDALVFHTQVTSLFSVGLMHRYPTVISLDATPINYDSVGRFYGHTPAGRGFLDRRKFQLNQRAFRAATRLIAWSDWARKSLIDDYGVDRRKIAVLAPGAAASYFRIGEQRAAFASDAREKRAQILFVGGDFQRKGGPLLLQALADQLGRRCELHVVTRHSVAARPGLHVYNHLSPNSPQLLRLFAQADLFVLPTLADCLAVVLMEATAAGLPVITTDVGALREALVPNESGLLVQPANVVELKAALDRLIADPDVRHQMGRTGHQLARRKFDAYSNNRQLLELVEELAATQRVRAETA